MGTIKLARFTQEERNDIVEWDEKGRSPALIAIYLNTLYRWHEKKDEVSPGQVQRYIDKVRDTNAELHQRSLKVPEEIASYLSEVGESRKNGDRNRRQPELYRHFGFTCPLIVD